MDRHEQAYDAIHATSPLSIAVRPKNGGQGQPQEQECQVDPDRKGRWKSCGARTDVGQLSSPRSESLARIACMSSAAILTSRCFRISYSRIAPSLSPIARQVRAMYSWAFA